MIESLAETLYEIWRSHLSEPSQLAEWANADRTERRAFVAVATFANMTPDRRRDLETIVRHERLLSAQEKDINRLSLQIDKEREDWEGEHRRLEDQYIAAMDEKRLLDARVKELSSQLASSINANVGRGNAPCDPVDACASHGRCWTHSAWDDPLEEADTEALKRLSATQRILAKDDGR